MFVMWGKQNITDSTHVNISFTASIARENPLNTNENSLENIAYISATKFRSNNGTREISLKKSYISATKFRSNNGTREISLKISLIIVEYSRITPNYVCITFAQYSIIKKNCYLVVFFFLKQSFPLMP